MSKPTLNDVLTRVSWFQRWEIEPGIFTPGPHDVQFLLDNLQLPADMSGKRVLDIGGWNGAFSFECERRGAAEVIMIEPTPTLSTGFDITHGYLGSKVKLVEGTIYNLDPMLLGGFDIVLCLGVIYHLRYPLLGLDNIRRVAEGDLYVESAILDTAAVTHNGIGPLSAVAEGLDRLPFLQFFDERQYFNDTTNWFVPNAMAADALIRAAGFDVVTSHVNGRYFAHAKVKSEPPMFKLAHEGLDYETHCHHLLGPARKWRKP